MTTPKLLLADDSVTIRKVVELTFADEGIEVFAVADGDAAMLKFVEIQPDIVLVDVEMPGPRGYQICEMIKQDDATKHIPVLLLVGSFEPFDTEEAERVGADGFLTKPFQSIRELVARVSDLLGMHEALPSETSEPDDITELYNDSFAETMPIQEYDTDEDLFGDSGLDDEMIEAIHPAGLQNTHDAEFLPVADVQEQIKDFDWSPTAKVVEEIKPETGFVFSETGPTIEIAAPDDGKGRDSAAEETVAEPSDDLVSLIAQRVVEKLSAHVIREIAQEAVPRIAEKLIREALEEENKG